MGIVKPYKLRTIRGNRIRELAEVGLDRLRKMTSGLLLAKIEPHFVIFRFIELKPSSDKTRLIDK